MARAPTLLRIHPTMALTPSGASATGSMKMPDPIIVPTTRALVIQMPIRPSFGALTRLYFTKGRVPQFDSRPAVELRRPQSRSTWVSSAAARNKRSVRSVRFGLGVDVGKALGGRLANGCGQRLFGRVPLAQRRLGCLDLRIEAVHVGLERLRVLVIAKRLRQTPRPHQGVRERNDQCGIAGTPADRVGTRIQILVGVAEGGIARPLRGGEFRRGCRGGARCAEREEQQRQSPVRSHHDSMSLTSRMPT